MGTTPGVLHLNEGHSGFAVLEAIRGRMEEEGWTSKKRCRGFPARCFHHPHAGAGRARSRSSELIEEHIGPLREAFGLSHERIMALGRENPGIIPKISV